MVSFFLVRWSGGRLGEIAPEFAAEVAEVRWLPLEDAPRLLAYGGERDMAAKAITATSAYDRRPCARAQLLLADRRGPAASGPKTATIRLGDKSAKYRKG